MSEPEPESNKTATSIAAAALFEPFDIDVKRREEQIKKKNKEDFRRGYVFTQVQRDDLVNIIYKAFLSIETRPEKEHRKIFEDMEKEYEVKFFEYINKNKPELSQEDIDDFTDGNNSKTYQSIRFNMSRKAEDMLREFRHDKAEEERDLYEASREYTHKNVRTIVMMNVLDKIQLIHHNRYDSNDSLVVYRSSCPRRPASFTGSCYCEMFQIHLQR